MNFYKHHIGDYAAATAHLSFVEDAAYSRLLRIYYRDEGPLPADLKAVQRLAGARTRDEKAAVETVLEEFFSLAGDGWHSKRCDEEIAEQRDHAEERDERKAHETERKRRYRKRRSELFEALRAQGLVPAFDTPIEELEALASRVPETSCPTGQVQGRPENGTAIQKPEARSTTPESTERTEESQSARALNEPPTPIDPTAAGRACLAMRRAGLMQTNPSHPSLLAAIAEGATDADFEHTAREAADSGKGFAWAIATVRGRLADAKTGASSHAAPRNGARLSAADRVLANVRAAQRRDQQQGGDDPIDGEALRIAR